MEAVQRENYDYALTLFQQALVKEPGFFECRKALRATQVTKASGTHTGFFKKMLTGAGSSPALIQARAQLLQSNPGDALVSAEQVLCSDPASSQAHKIIADAALALEFPRTAALSLEILHKASPRDREIASQLANTLADLGEVARAEAVMASICGAYPSDPDLAQQAKNISARRTLKEGGYEQLADGQGSYRDVLKDKEQAVILEQENKMVTAEESTQRLIAEYERRLASEPNNLKMLRSLAELYTQNKRFDDAIAYYQRIQKSDQGNDPSLDRAIAETVSKRFDHQIAQLDPVASDYAEARARIEAEKLAYLISECQKRVEKYPTDLQIRFEMGRLYFDAGKITEAIQEFQRAQNNPHKRIQAITYLGHCFARRGINDLAARTYQNAIKEKPVFDEEKKELIYALGAVLEKTGKREEAIEQFKLIYETDITYKDVSAKIDAYYAGGG